MKETLFRPFSGVNISVVEAFEDEFEQVSFDCASSSMSGDGLSSSEALSVSFGELRSEHGCASSSSGSSPLVGGWSLCTADKDHQSARLCVTGAKPVFCCTTWNEKSHRELSEVDMMKEKFSKLLLGEDMSGGGKGVCSALAISNAITNLSASVFGELWRLEPLSNTRKAMWRRELDWLLSVADHIVELVPSMQTFPDGSKFEVMVTRRRSDLNVSLPGLRKLDAMLLEALDNFTQTEFWYVDQGVVADQDGSNSHPPAHTHMHVHAQEEKWWLPSPKVPAHGLTEEGRKRLQYQRESLSQILKAALAINSQVLSEMEIPAAYWDGLPKNGKASLGERIYRHVTSEYFSAEALLSCLDLSTEHKALGVANRIEAAIHTWRRRRHMRNPQIFLKDCKQYNKNSSWGAVKDFVSDTDRQEFLAARAESVLLCLKQKLPGLRQSLLDMTKIQHNKDVGQSILESYSRVLESLAFNIIARIDDVLHVDDVTKHSLPPPPPAIKTRSQRRIYSLSLSVHTPHVTPLGSPSTSPTPSPTPRRTPNSPFHDEEQEEPDYITNYTYEVGNGHKDSSRAKEPPMK